MARRWMRTNCQALRKLNNPEGYFIVLINGIPDNPVDKYMEMAYNWLVIKLGRGESFFAFRLLRKGMGGLPVAVSSLPGSGLR